MTRHIAHITLESQTPLKVGSNASDFLQDSPIQKDWNGLPMVLGTSIAGVLRKHYKETYANDDLFGFQKMDKDNKDISEGSKVIFSNALLLDENNKVNESLLLNKSNFLKHFDNLPIREHTAITDKGVARQGSKFDEEVVYKGTRFKFSIEYIEDDVKTFESLLDLLASFSFRLGGGSTKGFGKFKIIEIKNDKSLLHEYSSSLNSILTKIYTPTTVRSSHITYTLKIKPDDFFMFGSGFGDKDADQTPVYEKVIFYDGEHSGLSEDMLLIPASSIKGALSHRTTYHYNKLVGNTIENKQGVASIKKIFGEAKNSKDKVDGLKGKVLLSDCFMSKSHTKVFDHVSIDRFTGGAIDGALFNEKTVADNRLYEIEILLENSLEGTKEQNAFEIALSDIVTGMLALGGATTKGHGVFCGTVEKNGNIIADGECEDEKN